MLQKTRIYTQTWGLLLILLAAGGCERSPQTREAAFLRKGRALLTAKDYSRALLEFRNAAKLVPVDSEPYNQMGLTYLASGDVRNAASSFRKCLEITPKHPEAQLKFAELMTASRNPDLVSNAAAHLRELVESAPGDGEAADALAMAEWQLGNAAEATRRLEAALQKLPSNLSSAVLLARMRLSQKDLEGAEQVLRAAAAGAPASSRAAVALGEFYLVTRQTGKAEVELRRAAQLDEKNAPAWIGLAAIQTAGNRMSEAEQTYRRISELPGRQYRPLHALFLYQSGNRGAALAELIALAHKDPADRVARTRVIQAELEMGKIEDASKVLADALRTNPKDIDALMQRAALSMRLGKAADAKRDLEQVVHSKPDDPEVHRALARAYRSAGLRQNERHELGEALRLDNASIPARLALARSYVAANDPKSALQLLDEAPDSEKGLLAILVDRNWALLAMNDVKTLPSSLNEALKSGRFPALVLQDALLKLVNRDFAGARAKAEEVLKASPRDARAARVIAESYGAQNQPANAARRLSELAGASPGTAQLEYLLGVWQRNTGDLTAARHALEAALAADPNLTAGYVALADLDRAQGHSEAAAQRLKAAIARDPGHLDALLLLAEIDKSSGNHADAIACYRAALLLDSTNLLALNNISMELAVSSLDEALGFAQRAVETAPENAAIQDTLGWIYYRKGLYSIAAAHLKTAVANSPTPAREFHLAMSYIRNGDRNLGREILQRALNQQPGLIGSERGW